MKQLDLLLSVIALLGGISLTIFSHQQMEVIEQPEMMLFQDHLVKGTRNYKITSAQSCIGDLQIVTESEQNVILTVIGTIRTTYHKVLSEVRVKVRGIFNPLEQLTDLSIHITFGDLKLILQTKGIHPIELKLTSEGLPNNINFSTSVPGPILIQEFEKDSFRIEYAQAEMLPSPLVTNFAGFFNKSIDLKVEPISGSSDPCLSDKTSRLHLVPLIRDLSRLTEGQGNMFKLLPPGMQK